MAPSSTQKMALAAFIMAIPAIVDAQSSDATCYWPNRQNATSDMLPCGGEGSDTLHSSCCNTGWTCLSNGLCMRAGDDPSNLAAASIVRGACTDQTWLSPDCPKWCIDSEEIDNVNVAQPISACPGVADAFYCVNGDDHSDCDEETDIIRFAGLQTAMTTIGVVASTATPPITSGATTGSAAADATGSSTGSPDSGGGGPDPLAIGLGVGIGLGALGLIIAGVFFFLWRRRGRKARDAAAAAAAVDGDAEGGAVAGAEKAGMASPGPDSVVTGSSELPNTMSSKIVEASSDAMVVEAPTGDPTIGRVEAPPNELRYEIATAEGIQGRHELMGSDVPLSSTDAGVSPVTQLSPGGTYGSPAGTVSPISPSVISRKPVG